VTSSCGKNGKPKRNNKTKKTHWILIRLRNLKEAESRNNPGFSAAFDNLYGSTFFEFSKYPLPFAFRQRRKSRTKTRALAPYLQLTNPSDFGVSSVER
jgi:hypothetical protein